MHRVIIPVDFSDTSFNAARYVAQMLAGQKDALAILYHNYADQRDTDICRSYLQSPEKELLPKSKISF